MYRYSRFRFYPGLSSSAILSRQNTFFFYFERPCPLDSFCCYLSSWSWSSGYIQWSSGLTQQLLSSLLGSTLQNSWRRSLFCEKFWRKSSSSEQLLRSFILGKLMLLQQAQIIRFNGVVLSIYNINKEMKRVKAGKRGEVIKYISRAKAIRKLQLSLKDFRKLCILKGVYPREPPKKLKRTSKTYYHLKDVNFLALDPIIEKIRAQKVYTKKYKKAKAKGDIGKIQYLVKHKPNISLNHLVRERYPEFIDALRDLDDPLSLMALFTIFPAHKEFNLTGDKIDLCAKLLKHFQLYVIRSHTLKKVFVSIKGIYYQCEIMGQKITYIVPFKYPADLPFDVDYRVMVTFLDFYLVLLKFVNFKLYSTLGLEYPPQEVDATTYHGYEFTKVQSEEQDERYKIDEEFNEKGGNDQKLLFSGLKFYLSTEVPRYSLEYVILACGGEVELENNDSSITHVITDRQNIKTEKTKEYVQPQWVYDSINFDRLLNVKEYQIGKPLPPHLSPFVDENDAERYIPERERELRGLGEVKEEKALVEEDDQKEEYDIIAESKKKQAKKVKQQKQFTQMSKNVMSNKNRKLLKVIEHSVAEKRAQVSKLKDKSSKLKKTQ